MGHSSTMFPLIAFQAHGQTYATLRAISLKLTCNAPNAAPVTSVDWTVTESSVNNGFKGFFLHLPRESGSLEVLTISCSQCKK